VTEQSIKQAIAEAERFIRSAKAALADRYDYEAGGHRFHGMTIGAKSGACRRASMDLTRMLADMRRP
jgi:hypothetical protein